jgi:pyruvate/2-oxoglutarate dehydrogenase complex dihydrolipoamide acyltransferase (E2) component
MAQNVIMPALGMAQETGVIVSWLKVHGDAVKKGEPLMEVETDKAVMEVEAQHDGYLADLRFGAGDTVPVGEVVALLLAEAPAGVAAAPSATPESLPAAAPAPAPAQAAQPAPAPAPLATAPSAAAPAPAPMANGRILASPKARRLAGEQGVDLRRLAAAGHPQPFHVADLTRLAALPASHAGGAVNRIAAMAAAANLAAFRALLADQTGGLPDAALWAAFAAGAMRAGSGTDASLVIRAERLPGEPTVTYLDPDLAALADLAPADIDAPASLILRDLTGGPLSDLALASDGAPVLCIADGYHLTLTWPEGSLSTAAAIATITGTARRIEQPLRHLL